jgi:hypothetical protein
MWDTWNKVPLSGKIRVGIFVFVAIALLAGMLAFLTEQEGLVAAVAAMLAGIPAIMFRLKQYNQDKAKRETSGDKSSE